MWITSNIFKSHQIPFHILEWSNCDEQRNRKVTCNSRTWNQHTKFGQPRTDEDCQEVRNCYQPNLWKKNLTKRLQRKRKTSNLYLQLLRLYYENWKYPDWWNAFRPMTFEECCDFTTAFHHGSHWWFIWTGHLEAVRAASRDQQMNHIAAIHTLCLLFRCTVGLGEHAVKVLKIAKFPERTIGQYLSELLSEKNNTTISGNLRISTMEKMLS